MHSVVESRLDEIAALCRQHRVKRLDVFGSAATGAFDPATSDVDFLVEFHEMDHEAYADAYFGLLAALEALFRREIDLVTARSLRNKYLIQSIYSSKESVFG